MNDKLVIRGAREYNLKNINLDIPKNKLVVITGLSGSGKSTLAFDTIYAEGQRRYVESLSAYARQFLEMMDKPDLDSIEGLSPAISIQQKTTSKNPRSTVGTITEIYDYLRLLYARIGIPHCTKCGRKISNQSAESICESVLKESDGKNILILAPLIQRKKGTYEKLFEQTKKSGYSRVRIDNEIVELNGEIPTLDKQKWHNIEIVVDRIKASKEEKSRLFESVQNALKAGKGSVLISGTDERIFSQNNACSYCGITIGELEPRTFSFNSPFGACKTCHGLGVKMEFDSDSESKREELRKFMRETPCNSCRGRRLKDEALSVRINEKSVMDVCDFSIDACHDFFQSLKLSETEKYIAKSVLKEILSRLEFLKNVGLNYLTLNRVSATLSGGESQRIRLATQIGSNLTGVLYVLDEPTIGLHQRDNAKLIKTLTN